MPCNKKQIVVTSQLTQFVTALLSHSCLWYGFNTENELNMFVLLILFIYTVCSGWIDVITYTQILDSHHNDEKAIVVNVSWRKLIGLNNSWFALTYTENMKNSVSSHNILTFLTLFKKFLNISIGYILKIPGKRH